MEKRKNILNPVLMFVTGLGLGFFIRLLDMYTQNLGNIFSRMAIWILMGVLISIYSRTKKRAMLNILLFCVGIVAVLGLTSIFFFERLRIDDFIIDGLLVYFLFFKKIKR